VDEPRLAAAAPPPTVRRRFRRGSGRTWFVAGTIAVLAYLILGPLAILIFSSFRNTANSLPFEAESPWTLQNYADVFGSSSTYAVMGNTFVYAAGALLLSFAMSITLAWLVERTDMPLRSTVFTVVIASLGIPAVLNGISWGLLLNERTGAINLAIRTAFPLIGSGPFNVYSMWGLIFVQAITMVPVTFLLITSAFRAMDSVLEEAGMTSGSRFRKTVQRITLPVLTPALLSALIYQLVTVVESFDIPLVIGLRANIEVLSTRIFLEVRPPGGLPDFGLASTYSILMLVIAAGPLLYYQYIIARSERFSTVSGKDYRQKRYELGRWKPVVVTAVVGYLALAVLFPLLILLWTSLQPFFAPPSVEALGRLTPAAYGNLFNSSSFFLAVRNTFMLGAVTSIGTMVLGFSTAWVTVRIRSRASQALDVLAFLPHAFPGVILALSVLLIYLFLPLPVVNTIWIIIIALTTQYISLSSRLMGSSIAQIQAQLEEAAAVSGARQGEMLRRILLPLVLPPFVNGVLLVFLMSIKNLTQALILYSPKSIVVSTLIFTRWDNGRTAETAAIGVMTVVVTLLLSILVRRAGSIGVTR
jgi:iron(III) transport system permease protein